MTPTRGQAGHLLQQEPGNGSTGTLRKILEDPESLPPESHHPQHIAHHGRVVLYQQLFLTTKDTGSFNPNVELAGWERRWRGRCRQPCSSTRDKSKGLHKLLGQQGGRCPLQQPGQVPGQGLQCPQAPQNSRVPALTLPCRRRRRHPPENTGFAAPMTSS